MDSVNGKGKENRIKFFVAVAVLTVSVVAVVFFCVSFLNGSGLTNKNIMVYKTADGCVVKIGKLETVVKNPSADDFKCDTENGRVFYTISSSYSDGLYDLYYIEKNRSELTKPKIIDYGIDKDYIFNSGKIYYLKNNSHAGANDAYCCDFDKSTIETFSSNVESIYPLDNSDTLYFIKFHGTERVLYKYSGETPIETDRNITQIHLYNDTDNPHILYETQSPVYKGMTELFKAQSEGSPELLCDNTFKVLYDEYSPDGNLYYFSSSSDNISWSYVIADNFEQTDKTLTRPKRDDFFSIFGISVEYNQKLREYQDKLVRDEIREALNESVEKGEFSAPVYTVYAYNSEGSHKITENVNPSCVYAVSKFGNPRIIYDSSEIVKSSTDMTTLVDIAQRSEMSEVIEYARSIINNSIKSTGIKISGYGKDGIEECSLEGYDKSKTLFSFSDDGNRIFALVRDTAGDRLRLYSSSLGSDLKPSQKLNVNNGISSYYFIGNSIIYLKSDVGKNTGDIFMFSGEENIKLSNAANALRVNNGDNIIAMKNFSGDNELLLADYYLIDGLSEELISENIIIDSFVFNNDDKTAFIVSSGNGNELYVYSERNLSQISRDVSEILLFN